VWTHVLRKGGHISCLTNETRRVTVKRQEHHLIWKSCKRPVYINKYKITQINLLKTNGSTDTEHPLYSGIIADITKLQITNVKTNDVGKVKNVLLNAWIYRFNMVYQCLQVVNSTFQSLLLTYILHVMLFARVNTCFVTFLSYIYFRHMSLRILKG
jgi:hypothetical protein